MHLKLWRRLAANFALRHRKKQTGLDWGNAPTATSTRRGIERFAITRWCPAVPVSFRHREVTERRDLPEQHERVAIVEIHRLELASGVAKRPAPPARHAGDIAAFPSARIEYEAGPPHPGRRTQSPQAG